MVREAMALILHIDTSTETGSVCLSEEGKAIASLISDSQKDHAAVIVPLIRQLFKDSGARAGDVDAISISAGPGSYTGLRVAASTAKGLCYAWNKPLIAINTLRMMANGLLEENETSGNKQGEFLLCPMLDARRQEVFTALYDHRLQEHLAPQPLILEKNSFSTFLTSRSIVFFGNGAGKFREITDDPTARFSAYTPNARHLIRLAEAAFSARRFADTAYFEPFYLKAFYTPAKKPVR